MFVDGFITLPDGRRVHYAHSAPAAPSSDTPVVAIHGLGS